MELWVGCVAGALQDREYVSKLQAAGFVDVEVEPWRRHNIDDARGFLAESGLDVDTIATNIDGRVASAFIRARKPNADTCCGPECCGR